MFNGRQRLRLFPTPTDADWLPVGSDGVQPSPWLTMWLGLSQVTLPFGLNLALGQATGVAPLEEDGEKAKEAVLPPAAGHAASSFILVRYCGPCFTGGKAEVQRG